MRSDEVPALDCLVNGHRDEEILSDDGELAGSFCTHCGTAAYDPDLLPSGHPWREEALILEGPDLP